MDETNCVGIHCFAEAHSCKVLEKRSMDYILEHFDSVYQQVCRKLFALKPICVSGTSAYCDINLMLSNYIHA